MATSDKKVNWRHWLWVAPVLIWAIVSIVVPFFIGKDNTHKYLEYLRGIQDIEMRTSIIITPGIEVLNREILQEGWSYRVALNIVRGNVPNNEQGFMIDLERQREDELIIQEADRARITGEMTMTTADKKILSKASSYFNDAFMPVQRTYLITIITRALQAISILVPLIALIISALYYGTYICRERIKDGQLPLAHRYVIYATCLKACLIGIVLTIIAPIPFPGIIIIIILYAGVIYFTALARSNTVPNI